MIKRNTSLCRDSEENKPVNFGGVREEILGSYVAGSWFVQMSSSVKCRQTEELNFSTFASHKSPKAANIGSNAKAANVGSNANIRRLCVSVGAQRQGELALTSGDIRYFDEVYTKTYLLV